LQQTNRTKIYFKTKKNSLNKFNQVLKLKKYFENLKFSIFIFSIIIL